MIVEIRDTTDRPAALDRLRRVARWAIDAATVPEMCEGCVVLDVVEDGKPVGTISLSISDTVATVNAAASTGQGTNEEITLLHDALKSKGVRKVRIFTRRPGAIRKTIAHGYRVQVCVLEKDL